MTKIKETMTSSTITVKPCQLLINGPYASLDWPLLVGDTQADLLREGGYKVVTQKEYENLLAIRSKTALNRSHTIE